ncbi:MAG: hypothetical protein VZR06_08770 [Butyrivibrio sp.]|jgi:hypothetical protein|nr:hypothetical protein [Butyrivibrio sp.]
MLQLSYLGIAFAFVFYLIFGITVKFMTLSIYDQNKARLGIVLTSLLVFAVSCFSSGLIHIQSARYIYGILFFLFSAISLFIFVSLIVELHQITARAKMRRFMVLFDIVDHYINEGKTNEEIMEYLTVIQNLSVKEASDFLTFITDPINHEFLSDVNAQIREAQLLKT